MEERTIPGEYKTTNIDRNFPGFEKKQYYTMEEMQKGDSAGTTETDSDTHPQGSGGYSDINKKQTKQKSRWPNNSGTG